MRRKLQFLTLFVFLHCISFAQKTDYYNYKYYLVEKEQEKSDPVDEMLKQYIRLDQMDTIDYKLVINNEEAVFEAEERLSNRQGQVLDMTDIMLESNGSYYYNFTDSAIYNIIQSQERKTSIKYDYSYINWQFESENEVVNGYECKKAVYSRFERIDVDVKREYKITVWYSEEINPNAVPFGLTGLPGGIVKINFNDHTIAVLEDFGEYKKDKKLKKPKLGEIITPEEYNNRLQEFNEKRRERNQGVDLDW